jgi:hypothetical protein
MRWHLCGCCGLRIPAVNVDRGKRITLAEAECQHVF